MTLDSLRRCFAQIWTRNGNVFPVFLREKPVSTCSNKTHDAENSVRFKGSTRLSWQSTFKYNASHY